MSTIILVTGATRSGKSRYGVERAREWGTAVVFIATYRAEASDPEMAVRVRRHRAERPDWRTLEAPMDIMASLRALKPEPTGVLIDCLTLWASERLELPEDQILKQWDLQLRAFREASWPTLIVTNEVGWGLVPPDPSARRFRDLAGALTQRTAAVSQEVWLLVAGCPLRVK
jgi:adenosylcobinamide kinase / adenosylcobinamide-phosphate guanylyltransferase